MFSVYWPVDAVNFNTFFCYCQVVSVLGVQLCEYFKPRYIPIGYRKDKKQNRKDLKMECKNVLSQLNSKSEQDDQGIFYHCLFIYVITFCPYTYGVHQVKDRLLLLSLLSLLLLLSCFFLFVCMSVCLFCLFVCSFAWLFVFCCSFIFLYCFVYLFTLLFYYFIIYIYIFVCNCCLLFVFVVVLCVFCLMFVYGLLFACFLFVWLFAVFTAILWKRKHFYFLRD